MIQIRCINAQQAHTAIAAQLWPWVKSMTMAGNAVDIHAGSAQDDRTIQQNRFYWGVVLKEVSQQAKLGGIGATPEGWHLYFKREHLGYEFTKTTLPGKKRPSVIKTLRSTKGLKVKPMSVYLEKCQAQAVTDFGVMFSLYRWQDYHVDPATGEILGVA